MKKTIALPDLLITVFFLLALLPETGAQNKVYMYYMNEKMEIVPKEKALIIGKGTQKDSVFMVQYYTARGNQLFMIENYSDPTLASTHGTRTIFHPHGRVSETSQIINNRLKGVSQKWDSAGHLTDSAFYDDDKLLYQKKMSYAKTGYLHNTVITDSLNDTMVDTDYDSTGNKLREISFVANRGKWTEYKKDGAIASEDSVFTREEEDARFPGGNNGWMRFLQKNLDGGVMIRNGATGGQGTVIVQFVVEKDGTLSNMKALTDIGYGTEKEVLRILRQSPKWIPAKRYGRVVKAYRKQPVTFQVKRI